MEFLVNDLSLSGQFADHAAFLVAVDRMMQIRREVLLHGHKLVCGSRLRDARITATTQMQQAVGTMPEAKRRAWMSWLSKQGVHWEADRRHGADDWLEVDGQVVTDCAIGEAAFLLAGGLPRALVSFQPSSWLTTPISVQWRLTDGSLHTDVSVDNYWTLQSVQQVLASNPKPVASWLDLEMRCVEQCTDLTFARDAFAPMTERGVQFHSGVADRIRVLLCTLNRLKQCFTAEGGRTAEGHHLYESHFTKGQKSWFTDSSDTEKHRFKDELTFPHPKMSGQMLSCTWHGKVKTPQLRVHFSWPISATKPLFVVYVGPKITKL